MSSSYPVPSRAVPVSAGMIVAVPLELVASPLRSGRDLGEADRSALVIGGTGKIGTGGAVVFLKVVAVAEAQVRRDGQVRAKGSPVHHATLGPLEGRLDAQAGPGVIAGIARDARLDGRLVKGERERLLARAFMIRVIVLMTLMPDARAGDVIAALAGDLAIVPWARPWHPASARSAGDWRSALGPVPLEELRDLVLGASWREHQEEGCPGAVTIGKARPLRAGPLDGTLIRVPDTPGNRAHFGSVGTGDDSSPFPQARALPVTCCPCRATFAMPHGPAGTDKAESGQSLLDEAIDRYPWLLDPGWIWIMDRNYHGAARIARMIRSAHVLIRLKSDVPLRRTSEILPDCSNRAELSGNGVTVPVRVIEYCADVEGQVVPEMFCLVTDLMDYQDYPGPGLAALYAWRFLSALGASAGVGVSSARAGVGCRNVAVAVGSVSHRRIGVVNECAGNHLLRGARGSRDACASWVPGCEEGPAVAVGGLLISVRGRCPGRVQAVWRPLARMIAAVTRRMLVWSRLPRQQARWTGMRWSARLAAIRIMLIADPAAPIRRASIAAMTSSQWM